MKLTERFYDVVEVDPSANDVTKHFQLVKECCVDDQDVEIFVSFFNEFSNSTIEVDKIYSYTQCIIERENKKFVVTTGTDPWSAHCLALSVLRSMNISDIPMVDGENRTILTNSRKKHYGK